jgi:hypothetical protein
MRQYRFGVLCAALAGAAIWLGAAAAPAHAQVPGGSYLESCRDVRAYGDTVSALCRREDGSWARTALRDAGDCRGGIANTNGRLTCGGRAGREYGKRRDYRSWGEGYGSALPPRDYGPRYFGGYNSLYGFGR